MKEYGIPEKIIELVKTLYDDFECAVVENENTTEWFKIKTGVKQRCNMSGFLFLMVLDHVMRNTVGNGENGIRWRFNTKLDDLDFADDLSMISSTKQHLQDKTTKLKEESERVGLKINAKETKVMRLNARNREKITIDNHEIEDVDKFIYLGATVSINGGGGMRI